MKISQRPVSAADDPFLFELYASTRAAQMALVPCTDSQKQACLEMQFREQKISYAKEYAEAQHAVICRDGHLADSYIWIGLRIACTFSM
jgi:hypothetical protein